MTEQRTPGTGLTNGFAVASPVLGWIGVGILAAVVLLVLAAAVVGTAP